MGGIAKKTLYWLEIQKRKILSITIICTAIVVFANGIGITRATYCNQETSDLNSFRALTSNLWTQTTQSDFNNGIGNQVNITSSPGDVSLQELADWYNPAWNYRKKISIDHTEVDANLTDFPVLVSLSSDQDLSINAQDNGDDILFTSSDGLTKLSHEIESFNKGNGELIAWVNIPVLSSSTDTDIYLYYGNPACANQEDVTNVWDGNFKMVQHMDDAPPIAGGPLYANDFETEVGFDYGSLNPVLSVGASKNGQYGIRGNGFKGYRRACRQENSGRNVVFESWVCPRNSDVTSLAAVCFGQQTSNERYGYQCLIDQRSGGVMQIRKNYDSSSPLAQSAVPINEDTWYWFRVTWETSGLITFELYDTALNLIMTISATDNTYTDGYYGVAAYQNADWDDYYVEQFGIVSGTRTSDSTSHENDGTKRGTDEPYVTTAKIGNGQNFDGNNDYINCGSATSLQVDYISVEAWVKFDTNTGKRVIASIDDGSNRRWGLYLLDGSPYVLRFFVFVNDSYASPDYPWQPVTDTWYHIVAVKSADYVRTYIDGVEVGTPQYHPGVMDKDSMNLRIGVGSYPGYFDGVIDEVRISNIDRSAAWISTCFNNQSSPNTFYILGSESGKYPSSGTLASQILDTNTENTIWNALFWDETLPNNTDIWFEVRASNTPFSEGDATPDWIDMGGTTPVTTGLPQGRYLQWRVILLTLDNQMTPILHEVRAYYY
jgi:hypothetical protein